MTERTPLGKIDISPEAIASLAGQAVLECYGVVGMSPRHLRDGLADILHRDNLRRGVEVTANAQGIIIDLYVVLEYGTRISTVAHNVMSNVKFAVEKALGIPVAQVNVHIQGLRVSDVI